MKQINNIVSNRAQLKLKPEALSELKGKKDLHRVFTGFGEICTQASPEAKRRILSIIIEEIRCSVKRGERKGEILYRLRGDGSVKKSGNRPENKKTRTTIIWLFGSPSGLAP